VKRYMTTRPARLTLLLLGLAALLVAASFFSPAVPRSTMRLRHHVRVTDPIFGWQIVLFLTLRYGGLLLVLAAALRHQRTADTLETIVREERAPLPYDRTAGIDARGNTAVDIEPTRRSAGRAP
jgi:hypothetical protein